MTRGALLRISGSVLAVAAAIAACSGGSATSGSATAGGGSSTGSGAACFASATDTACLQCTKASCCPEMSACGSDPDCGCWSICYANHPGDYDFCITQCPQPNATTDAFSACIGNQCGSVCGTTPTSSSSSASSASSTSGSTVCSPMAGDGTCQTCTKTNCCPQLTSCAGDATCLCWMGCLYGGGTTTSCTQKCSAPDQVTNGVLLCAAQLCMSMCP